MFITKVIFIMFIMFITNIIFIIFIVFIIFVMFIINIIFIMLNRKSQSGSRWSECVFYFPFPQYNGTIKLDQGF